MRFGLNKVMARFLEAEALLTLLCLLLLVFRAINTSTLRYWFIPANLVLAWGGLFFSLALVAGHHRWRWLNWKNLLLLLAWLFFLPNTWYTLTDFIHVYPTGEISELFDIVLMANFALVGMSLGFASLLTVHKELARRLSGLKAYVLIELVIVLASYGIYLGRVLRWNSWDALSNPTGIIINFSDRIIDPLGHPHVFLLAGLFFVLISVVYFVLWRTLEVVNFGKNPA